MLLGTAGCGTFVAHRLAQAPNTYPQWFAPKARVTLGFSPKFLSSFPAQFVQVGPPEARLCYRVVPPADYQLQVSSSNRMERGERQFDFKFHAIVPGRTNQWSAAPRGTVMLLHGYGLAQFLMAPWALRLAQEGWQCVLVDLRGHGKSTGRRIFFGARETGDLSQLLDKLKSDGQLAGPVEVVGESYGAALALRWKTVEPRLDRVVAISPYCVLSNSVLNIARDYAGWMPEAVIKAGLKKLPGVLEVPPGDLDMDTVLARNPVSALFVASAVDKITPLADVERVRAQARPDSVLVLVPEATHESLTYFFDDIIPPALKWLNSGPGEIVTPPDNRPR